MAWAVGWSGGLLIALALQPVSRGGQFPALPTYAAHAWLFAVAMFWFFVLRKRFPVGGFRRRELRPWMWTWLVAAALILGSAPFSHGGVHQPWPVMAQWLFMALALIGPTEEFLSRGLVQTGLNSSIAWSLSVRSVRLSGGTVVAAVLFGLAHLTNVFAHPIGDVLPQVAGATLIGLAIGVFYDRWPNLWGASVLHNIIDGLQAVVGYI